MKDYFSACFSFFVGQVAGFSDSAEESCQNTGFYGNSNSTPSLRVGQPLIKDKKERQNEQQMKTHGHGNEGRMKAVF